MARRCAMSIDEPYYYALLRHMMPLICCYAIMPCARIRYYAAPRRFAAVPLFRCHDAMMLLLLIAAMLLMLAADLFDLMPLHHYDIATPRCRHVTFSLILRAPCHATYAADDYAFILLPLTLLRLPRFRH